MSVVDGRACIGVRVSRKGRWAGVGYGFLVGQFSPPFPLPIFLHRVSFPQEAYGTPLDEKLDGFVFVCVGVSPVAGREERANGWFMAS